MAKPTILVVGATGFLGKEVVRMLCESGLSTRAVVRSTAADANRAAIVSRGAELVAADLKDAGALDAACRGVTTVISTASATVSRQPGDSIATVDEKGQLALVEAAERAGVGHFVFVSFPPKTIDYALQRAKRRVEARLRTSSMTYTILQPTHFLEIWLGPFVGFDLAKGKVRIHGPGTRPVSWISMHDVARFTAAAAEGGAFAGRELPLGGPDPLSPLEVVAIFEELGGGSPSLEFIDDSTLESDLDRARADPLHEAYAATKLNLSRGQTVDPGPALNLLPGRLRSVREYARQLLKTEH
jgi:NADH dehydrogenase